MFVCTYSVILLFYLQSNFVKTSLCLEGVTDYSCLLVFPVVVKCGAFYQFIKEGQFMGEEGQARFQQQYHQMSAQLQHDTNVLNQLKAAFGLMTPFMDREQSLKELMTRVTQLDSSHGLKQLETVNESVTLVQQRFSHSEVSHFSSSSSFPHTSPPPFPAPLTSIYYLPMWWCAEDTGPVTPYCQDPMCL